MWSAEVLKHIKVVWYCLFSLFLEDVPTATEGFQNMFLILSFVLIVMRDWKAEKTEA